MKLGLAIKALFDPTSLMPRIDEMHAHEAFAFYAFTARWRRFQITPPVLPWVN